MKGGYHMVNFKNVNLTSSPASVPGTYEAIEGNYRKSVMAVNLVIDGREIPDCFVRVGISGSDYTLLFPGGITLTITDDDMVSKS